MKIASTFVLAALFSALTGVGIACAGTETAQTPTTRILAIGTVNPGVDIAAVRSLLPVEVRETVQLYLDGKIDQWFSLEDRNGVVFVLNLTDTKAAAEMLENLPLGRAHLMHFDLMRIGPLNPLRQLPGMSAGSP